MTTILILSLLCAIAGALCIVNSIKRLSGADAAAVAMLGWVLLLLCFILLGVAGLRWTAN